MLVLIYKNNLDHLLMSIIILLIVILYLSTDALALTL